MLRLYADVVLFYVKTLSILGYVLPGASCRQSQEDPRAALCTFIGVPSFWTAGILESVSCPLEQVLEESLRWRVQGGLLQRLVRCGGDSCGRQRCLSPGDHRREQGDVCLQCVREQTRPL